MSAAVNSKRAYVNKYINNKTELKEFLEYESIKYGRKNTRMPFICLTEQSYLYKYNVFLRKTEYYINTGKKFRGLLYKALLYRYGNDHQIHIPINTFDRGLKLMHLGPILVNGRVKGGKDISLHINTSIVAGGTNDGTPILEDGVIVGVGAVIVGDIKLAKNIAVGANSVVNKTFEEENIAIAGVPAKKISNNGRLEWNKK
ncbi:serine acetyltransferase [Clostridium sp. BSD9I1]|uniref:serine acetyltransferase n=1 Tax=Clostridium sp. BSD9I1 TaxID=2003589 RepID=UPI001647FF45|nr:serine acetyltransferase [Clostridium sp. BSD9I1]